MEKIVREISDYLCQQVRLMSTFTTVGSQRETTASQSRVAGTSMFTFSREWTMQLHPSICLCFLSGHCADVPRSRYGYTDQGNPQASSNISIRNFYCDSPTSAGICIGSEMSGNGSAKTALMNRLV